MPLHLKYVATLRCNFSLITTIACDCRLFSDIIVSLGSVATHMRCGGILNNYLNANLLENQRVKEFWKSVELPQYIKAMSFSVQFLAHPVLMSPV